MLKSLLRSLAAALGYMPQSPFDPFIFNLHAEEHLRWEYSQWASVQARNRYLPEHREALAILDRARTEIMRSEQQ